MNSDLTVDRSEKLAAEVQFARFASVCRPFAPIYRQMTVASIAAYTAGADILQPLALAYGDVAAAWRNYLATKNQGRPYVLIGHSQGSLMLIQLIAREIEGKPEAARMKLAIIAGFNVLVPEGKLVGGSFKSTPLCSRPGETGCVISWVSFREKNAPPPGAIFGYSDKPGMTVGCVNPARPGSRDWVPFDSYWFARSTQPVPGGPINWSSEGPPPTPFLRPGPGFGQMRQRRAARLSVDPHQRRSQRQAHRPDRRRGRAARHVPARLGHAPCRYLGRAGRFGPRGRRDQRSIQNSCSTLSPSAAASLIAKVADGVNTLFSTVLTVFRVTPTFSASSAWVRPSSMRRSLIRLASRSAIPNHSGRCARRSNMPNRRSAAPSPSDRMTWIASRAVIGENSSTK